MIKLYFSYAEVQNSFGRIYNAIGRDPLPLDQKPTNLYSLAKIVSEDDNARHRELYGLASLPTDAPFENDPQILDEVPNPTLMLPQNAPTAPKRALLVSGPALSAPPKQISGSLSSASYTVHQQQDLLADDTELWNLPVTIRLQ